MTMGSTYRRRCYACGVTLILPGPLCTTCARCLPATTRAALALDDADATRRAADLRRQLDNGAALDEVTVNP